MLAASILDSLLEMPQIAILLGIAVPIVAIIAGAWYKIHKVRSENELKRSLVERGASVEEIERILAATSHDRQKRHHG